MGVIDGLTLTCGNLNAKLFPENNSDLERDGSIGWHCVHRPPRGLVGIWPGYFNQKEREDIWLLLVSNIVQFTKVKLSVS